VGRRGGSTTLTEAPGDDGGGAVHDDAVGEFGSLMALLVNSSFLGLQ
jgi:hypothetical protein